MNPGQKDSIMGVRDDPKWQMINAFVSREDARRLLDCANALGWSRSELLRRMIRDFLAHGNGTAHE